MNEATLFFLGIFAIFAAILMLEWRYRLKSLRVGAIILAGALLWFFQPSVHAAWRQAMSTPPYSGSPTRPVLLRTLWALRCLSITAASIRCTTRSSTKRASTPANERSHLPSCSGSPARQSSGPGADWLTTPDEMWSRVFVRLRPNVRCS